MKKVLSLILGVSGLLLFNISAQAQVTGYLGDVIRYNQTLSGGGTARIRGMGGAGTALGGDISSAYLNPAGLGFYNRSDFSITPGYLTSGNDATYLGSSNYQYQNNLNISNLGLAFRGSIPETGGSGWLGGTFAISYQQLNNFSNSFTFEGSNPDNSLVDSYLQYDDATIDGLINSNDVGTTLAFNTFLIDDAFYTIGANKDTLYYYDTYFPVTEGEYPVRQLGTVKTTGSQGQWNFSYGGNFSDKIYLGAGIGISSLTYRRQTTYQERVNQALYEDFPGEEENYPNYRLETEEDLRQEGGGINATIGFIGRPLSSLTVGLSYRTPTFYSIEESIYNRYNNYFLGDPVETADDERQFSFNIRTPGVLNTGVAYFFKKYGILTADLEYMDYSNSRLTDSNNFLQEDNNAIPDFYSSVINYRLGGEYRYNNLRVRLGYAHQGSPYIGSDKDNYNRNSISGGVGLRWKAVYADLAVVGEFTNALYAPYTTDLERYLNENGEVDFRNATSPVVDIEKRKTSVLLTIGFNFSR